MAHSIPYTRTVTGVGYDVTRLGENPDPTWAVFADERFKNRMTLLDDSREMFAAALKYLNFTKGEGRPDAYDINTVNDAEIADAVAVLNQWKKNIARFDVDGAKTGLEDGTFLVVHQYNGDVAKVMANNPNIRFFVPKEGSAVSSDDFVVLRDAPRPELAQRFIDFMLEPENAARNMADIKYYMPIPEALEVLDRIAPELARNPAFNIPTEMLTRCSVIRDIGDDLVKYTRAYEMVVDTQ